MTPLLVFGIGFAVVGVCLLALIAFDRRRFWNISEPAGHTSGRRDVKDEGPPVSRTRAVRYNPHLKGRRNFDPTNP